MFDMRIGCKVEVPVRQQCGSFADAFRVSPLGDKECVLDFMSLSQCRTQASVVARIRVEKKFLTSIRDRLESTLLEEDQNLTSKQIEEMWFQVDQLPVSESQAEGAWFAVPPEKVN